MKRGHEISLNDVFQEFETTVTTTDICPVKQCRKFLRVVTGTGLFPKTRDDLRTIIEVILQGEGGGIGNPDLNRRCWICFYQSYYKLLHDVYDSQVGDDFGLEYVGPDYLSRVPKDIARLVGSELDYEDVLSLCRTNKRLNDIVCNNQDFYRALRRRDYGHTWNYFMLPEEILPLEKTEVSYDYIQDVPVYWGRPRQIVKDPRGSALIRAASLPGTGNTVRIHDTDYIWYYFMWAPKFNKEVNYSKKFTNAEILEDLKGNPRFGTFGGPSEKRMKLIRAAESGFFRDMDFFRLPWYLNTLYPRVVQNSDLEYAITPITMLFGMMSDDNLPADLKAEYRRRLEDNEIMPQLIQLENQIVAISPPNALARQPVPEDPKEWERNVRRALVNKLERILRYVKGTILSHEQNDNSSRDPKGNAFEFSESFWPEFLHEQMIKIYDVASAKIREILERW